MNLDWEAWPIPGKSMFNLELGTGYADVVSLLKAYEISEGVFKVENSCPMRLIFRSNPEIILFKKLDEEIYDWQSDLALLCFRGGCLVSITTYANGSSSYKGLICGKVGLGEEISGLVGDFGLEYDDVDEVISVTNGGTSCGLELHGASCDLSVDPGQKIFAMKVFVV